MKYQVTLYNPDGKYKPVSCIVNVAEGSDNKTIQTAGVKKICQKRYWQMSDLKKYNYSKVKMRKVVDN